MAGLGCGADYVRFVLTHLAKPQDMLAQAWQALAPGGVLVVEDIDYEGKFCEPPCPAFERHAELYVAAARQRGADPFIGRRLVRLLEEAAFPASTDRWCSRSGVVATSSRLPRSPSPPFQTGWWRRALPRPKRWRAWRVNWPPSPSSPTPPCRSRAFSRLGDASRVENQAEPLPEARVQPLLKTPSVAVRDSLPGGCRHRSAEECARATEL